MIKADSLKMKFTLKYEEDENVDKGSNSVHVFKMKMRRFFS